MTTITRSPETDASDHFAFYTDGVPFVGPMAEQDTGLRCFCGREVVGVEVDEDVSPTGWAHVGIGDLADEMNGDSD